MGKWEKRRESLGGGIVTTPKCYGPPGPCRYCSTLLPNWRSSARVCNGEDCRRRYNADRNRPHTSRWAKSERGKELKAKNQARYRARKKGARRAEYNRIEIFERDGWKCQLCGERVDQRLAGPNPRSASIDHIVPLSRGGDDAPWNVQLAHYGCNSSKKNQARGEQIRLAM